MHKHKRLTLIQLDTYLSKTMQYRSNIKLNTILLFQLVLNASIYMYRFYLHPIFPILYFLTIFLNLVVQPASL